MGVMLSAAGSLQWLHETLGGPPYEDLLAEAERWEPGTEGLLFQPYLQGERTPHADPDARGAFVGLTLRHDRGALTRAVLEGVAYGLRDSLELLGELGVEAEVGRVSGGGARSELWLKIVASVLGLPLERTSADEGAAYGAALLGGVRRRASSPTRTLRSRPASASPTGSSPTPAGRPFTKRVTPATACSTPPFGSCRASARRSPSRPSRRAPHPACRASRPADRSRTRS